MILCTVLVLIETGGLTFSQPVSRPNVILITIDTLRVDYVSCYGNAKVETPTLDALARDGTLFERAYCQAPMTPPSHASILTGVYPPTHGVRDFTATGLRLGFPTLAGLLKKNGFTTAAFVSAYVLDSVWGLNQGFDLYYDHFEPREFQGVNPGNVQRKAGETISLALDWLRKGPRSAPYFLWVHLFDPHHDYNPPEPYRAQFRRDPYGGEVAYADHELGRLVAALKQRGDYDQSIIVAVSDHGEAFGEHEEAEHGFFIYDITTRIPLIVKLPRGAGTVARAVKQIADTVDIAPTILQFLRIEGDRQIPMQGRGLLSLILGKPASSQGFSYSETLYPRNTFGWSDLASYIEGKYKYIEAPHPELYDLAADPGEKNNLYASQRAVAGLMKQKLDQFRQRLQPDQPVAGPADPQRMEALRSLGYVAVSVPVQRKPGQEGLIDPKDRVRLFNKILLAMQASDAGALGKSNALLEEVVQEDPDLFIGHYSMGVNSLKSGDNQKALDQFARARRLNPAFDLTEMNTATALARLGRVDEAISTVQAVLKLKPGRLEARKQLAMLFSRKKDYAAAIETYRQILAGRPRDAIATKFMGIAEVESEKYDAGLRTLQQAISLGADDALTQNFLGIAFGNLGRTQEAAQAYQRALAIKTDYQQARLNLTFALLKLGRTEEAKKEFAILCQANARLCDQYRRYFP